MYKYLNTRSNFELALKYIEKCQYNSLSSKLLLGKKTQKVNKQKIVFREIGCSHEVTSR